MDDLAEIAGVDIAPGVALARKWTTASGGVGALPASKPSKLKCVVRALKTWPLSVTSAISVLTPGSSSGFRSTFNIA
jgi:hypothetical protein